MHERCQRRGSAPEVASGWRRAVRGGHAAGGARRRTTHPTSAATTDAARIATFATSSSSGESANASSPMNRDIVNPIPATHPALSPLNYGSEPSRASRLTRRPPVGPLKRATHTHAWVGMALWRWPLESMSGDLNQRLIKNQRHWRSGSPPLPGSPASPALASAIPRPSNPG